jgi:LEA14-like dessication related protein
MNKYVKWGIIGGVTIGVIGLTYYLYRQLNKLYDYCYAMSGAVIKKFTLNQISLTLMIKLKNNSDITVELGEQNYNVYINDYYVGTVKYTKPATWYGKSVLTFPVDVEFQPQDLLKAGMKNIQALIADKSKIIIKIEGFVNAKSGILNIKDFKFDYTMSLADLLSPTEPSLSCKNFK